jgi:hypothetical protein
LMELGPRSGKLSNVLSVVSRTSPTVFRGWEIERA